MKILLAAHLLPLPLDSGGKIKSYYALKALASRHEVHLLAYTRSDDERQLVGEFEGMCATVRAVTLNRGVLRRVWDLAATAALGASFIVTRDYRPEMLAAFREAVERIVPDLVHIDHLQMAQFVDFSASYRTVLDHHNIESVIIQRIAETATSLAARAYAGIEWPKLRRYELEVCRACDLVITVSDEDRDLLRRLDSEIANVETVPIGVDVDHFQPVRRDAGSLEILSVGTMYWPPNVDSMLYFHDQILPLVRRELPDCTLTIAGQRPAPAITALAADPAVKVTGYVDDMREPAAHCGVFVVPLRSGSGVRVKILNALAMGLPVVSTSVGAEGLELTHGEQIMIADTPEDFARAVVDVLNDRGLADRLGAAGRKLVCEKYSWEIVGKRLLDLYDARFGDGSPSPQPSPARGEGAEGSPAGAEGAPPTTTANRQPETDTDN